MKCESCYYKGTCESEENEEKCKKYVEVVDDCFIKLNKNTCKQCRYSSVIFGANSGTKKDLPPICCDYRAKSGEFRVISKEGYRYDPKLCDKFEAGKRIRVTSWDTSIHKRKRIKGGLL